MSIFFYTKSALLDSLEKIVQKNVTQHVKDVTMSMAGVNTVVIQDGKESIVKHVMYQMKQNKIDIKNSIIVKIYKIWECSFCFKTAINHK